MENEDNGGVRSTLCDPWMLEYFSSVMLLCNQSEHIFFTDVKLDIIFSLSKIHSKLHTGIIESARENCKREKMRKNSASQLKHDTQRNDTFGWLNFYVMNSW